MKKLIEIHFAHRVYWRASDPDDKFAEEVDEKSEAIALRRECYPNGEMRCCAYITVSLGGAEVAVGKTKAEAVAKLRHQVREYGYRPILVR